MCNIIQSNFKLNIIKITSDWFLHTQVTKLGL